MCTESFHRADVEVSRFKIGNCVSRNQAQTLAHERVTRQLPTLDSGSTILVNRGPVEQMIRKDIWIDSNKSATTHQELSSF